jgi:hemoglobin-like flavoprotein
MTPDQKSILRDTWRSVAPIADQAAQLFYDRLFEIDPATQALFARTAMPEQRAKLMEAIGAVIDKLDELDLLVPTIEALGRRHAGYGVTDAHYVSVGAALLWTLEQGLGEAWTPEAAEAWSQAYTLLADTMRRAAAQSMAAA